MIESRNSRIGARKILYEIVNLYNGLLSRLPPERWEWKKGIRAIQEDRDYSAKLVKVRIDIHYIIRFNIRILYLYSLISVAKYLGTFNYLLTFNSGHSHVCLLHPVDKEFVTVWNEMKDLSRYHAVELMQSRRRMLEQLI